jgi:thioredoxin reductase (NADPH)
MVFDVIIIGTGPAGLTAGIFAVRRGLKTLVFGDPFLLSQIANATLVDNYPGFFNIHGAELLKRIREHAVKLGVKIKEERVINITKIKNEFIVRSDKERYKAKTIIFATGASHRKASVSGESNFVGKGVSYCPSCDAPLFKGKKVLVIGGGDSAVSGALLLDHIGAITTLIHRRDELRAVESLQKQLLNSGVKILWNKILLEIRGDKFVKSVIIKDVKTNQKEELDTDGVFISIGTIPTAELAKDIGVRLDDKGFIEVDKEQKTSIQGVFAAGDCCNNSLKQLVSACSDGAIAATSAYTYIMEKYI